MQAAHNNVDDLGYQDMPKEAYQKWLKSIDQEKRRQATKEIRERMKREIDMLKKLKPTFQNNIKG